MDIVLDTGHLAEFLGQYYDANLGINKGIGRFQESKLISKYLARMINEIMLSSKEGISELIITSAFSFIEITNHWEKLVNSRFSAEQMYTFINQTPEWFSIAPVDNFLIPYFIDVPNVVEINAKLESIEWTDAIHMAVVYSRGKDATLATTDHKLLKILKDQGRLII
jgi:hypothetical protein